MIVLDIEAVPSVGPDDERYVPLAAEAAKRKSRRGPGQMTCEEYQQLSPLLARPVAIAMWNMATMRGQVAYDVTLLGADHPVPQSWEGVKWGGEHALLTWAHDTLDKFDKHTHSCGFFSRRYDLPLLWHRANIWGIRPSAHVTYALRQKPWERTFHVDLARVGDFDGVMDTYGLRTYALAYGLADPKASGSGRDVLALLGHDPAGLLAYVCDDVLATACLATRFGFGPPAPPEPTAQLSLPVST